MRIAIAASLQGFPEEWDTDTEDATRIANACANIVKAWYPSFPVEVFDRSDYLGQGDVFLKVKNDIERWGADISVHIHQDAGPPSARGFTVLYWRDLKFARIMGEAMYRVLNPLGVPFRGLMQRGNVAVLKASMPVVLVECGFYTSPADEAIGTMPYAQSVADGIRDFLQEAYGIGIEQGEEEIMYLEAKLWVDPNTGEPILDSNDHFIYNVPNCYITWWLNVSYEGPDGTVADVEVWANIQKGHVGTQGYGREKEVGNTNAGGLHVPIQGFCEGISGDWFEISIHSDKPVNANVGRGQ